MVIHSFSSVDEIYLLLLMVVGGVYGVTKGCDLTLVCQYSLPLS